MLMEEGRRSWICTTDIISSRQQHHTGQCSAGLWKDEAGDARGDATVPLCTAAPAPAAVFALRTLHCGSLQSSRQCSAGVAGSGLTA